MFNTIKVLYSVDTEDTDTVDGDLFAPSTWSILAVCGGICGTLAVCFEAICQISGF